MAQILRIQISSLEADLAANPKMPETNPQKWLSSLAFARSTITTVDRNPILKTQLGPVPWLRLVQALQGLAYQDPDAGGEADIALWCERQWATEVQRQPNNVAALQGESLSAEFSLLRRPPPARNCLGHAWLLKSQKPLARIHRDEGSSSSTSSSSLSRNGVRSASQDARDTARINAQDYVEARDTLRPSLEALDRALEVADSQAGAGGELLTLVLGLTSRQMAEACISFGNVSHPQRNEAYYQRALRLLQRAGAVEGYRLDVHLQQFLDDNIRYIE
ncbi:hypothetical protein MMC13_008509 [Lambiella insularis]|nr:hypothetical protein [Lambiella insularis]